MQRDVEVRRVLVLFCVALSVVTVASAAEAPRTLRAGAVAIDITPTKLPVIVNGGMREQLAERIVDPLHARCIVLDDGATRIALAIVDNCVIPRSLMDQAKSLAEKRCGIPASRILISATHAHSCPSVLAVLGTGQNDDYAEFLAQRIAEGIATAAGSLVPARVGWAVGQDPKNVFCRRYLMKPGTAATNRFSGKQNDRAQMNPGFQNPNAIRRTGVADPDVSVLSIQTREGKPLALLANYSTHYAGAPAISADYFGTFCERMTELVGAKEAAPAFVAAMSNGTSGDANCNDFNNPPRKYDRFTVARDVAEAAFAAYQTIQYSDSAPIVMVEELLQLAIRKPTPAEVAEAQEFLQGKIEQAGWKPATTEEVYARETLLADQLPPTRELKLQAIRIGGLGIVAIPCEVFGTTGLTIKKESPLKPTFTIELANGYDGYLPPPDQHELGGYTTWRARSSCLEIEAEPKIRTAVLALLAKASVQTSE